MRARSLNDCTAGVEAVRRTGLWVHQTPWLACGRAHQHEQVQNLLWGETREQLRVPLVHPVVELARLSLMRQHHVAHLLSLLSGNPFSRLHCAYQHRTTTRNRVVRVSWCGRVWLGSLSPKALDTQHCSSTGPGHSLPHSSLHPCSCSVHSSLANLLEKRFSCLGLLLAGVWWSPAPLTHPHLCEEQELSAPPHPQLSRQRQSAPWVDCHNQLPNTHTTMLLSQGNRSRDVQKPVRHRRDDVQPCWTPAPG